MQVISGKKFKPFNVLIVGTQGIGKSSWAAAAPSPLFLGAEELDELEVDRLPQVTTFDEFEEQLKWVLKDKPKNKTLVIDTIDSVEKLLHKKIIADDSKSGGSMAKALGGYGKAYEAAESAMIRVRDEYLRKIRDELGMNIIILAHCKKVTVADTILGIQYDSYDAILHQKVNNVFSDWVSMIGFASYVAHQVDDSNSSKVFALGHGERVLLTEKRPGHPGKNRFNLPYEMPLDFSVFYSKFKAFYESGEVVSNEDLVRQIMSASENLKDLSLREKIVVQVAAAKNDNKKLTRVLGRVQELTQ